MMINNQGTQASKDVVELLTVSKRCVHKKILCLTSLNRQYFDPILMESIDL